MAGLQGLLPLPEAVTEDLKRVRVRRLAETLQTDEGSMAKLLRVGAMPGADVEARRLDDSVTIGSAGEYVEMSAEEARHILVEART